MLIINKKKFCGQVHLRNILLNIMKHVSLGEIILGCFIDSFKKKTPGNLAERNVAWSFSRIYLISEPFLWRNGVQNRMIPGTHADRSNIGPSANCFSFLVLEGKFYYLIIFCCYRCCGCSGCCGGGGCCVWFCISGSQAGI